MAGALVEVGESLGRNLALNKEGPAHGQLERLARCIDGGLAVAKSQQEQVKAETKRISEVAATLEKGAGTLKDRRKNYRRLLRGYRSMEGEFYSNLAKVMTSWQEGLFVGVRGKKNQEAPVDNLELERWFRAPKRHERKIHGRRHAGIRIVQEGPTLLLAVDAHEAHPKPFTAEELLPYRNAQAPPDQLLAIERRKVMRKARSTKKDNCCWQS
jgi:hypothetical protein